MVQTNYLWDHANDSCLAETDIDGNATAVYTVDPDTYGAILSQRRGSDTSYFSFDAIGSTRQLTNTSCAVTDRMDYDAWGIIGDRIGTTIVPYTWAGETGYYYDAEVALFNVRNRAYAPFISRWLSRDPFLGGPPALFPYVYATNQPSRLIDPPGLAPIVYTPGRGRFTVAQISSDYDTGAGPVPSAMGSNIHLTWAPSWQDFCDAPLDLDCIPICCRCNVLGYAQIIKTTDTYINAFLSRWPALKVVQNNLKPRLAQWHIDRRVPYPLNPTATVCPPTLTKPPVNLVDHAGPIKSAYSRFIFAAGTNVPVGFSNFNLLIDFTQTAEACVICVQGGRERPSKSGIFVYGCVTWSHDFQRSASTWLWAPTGFTVRRTLEGQSAFAPTPSASTILLRDISGHAPSKEMEKLIQSYYGL